MLKRLLKFFAALFGRKVDAPVRDVIVEPVPREPPRPAQVPEAGGAVPHAPQAPATLLVRWRAGDMQGIKPEQAFFVRCDATTMTQADIAARRVICLVGFAIVRPAEFEIVRIGWTTTPP